MTDIATWQIKIYTNWKRYKKLIPAVVGFTALIVLKHLDIELPGFGSVVLDWMIAAAGTFGVFQLKNEPKQEAITIDTEIAKVNKGE